MKIVQNFPSEVVVSFIRKGSEATEGEEWKETIGKAMVSV